MLNSEYPKNTQFIKNLLWFLAGVIIVVGVGFWVGYRYLGKQEIKIIWPNGKEKLIAGRTYQIAWKAKKVGDLGIMLVKGEGVTQGKWIATGIPFGKKKYDWEIFVWEAPGQDYKIAIFEYPWKEGNIIDYSDEPFTISGPQFASCDTLSIETEWPHIPSDYPDLRKVFITENSWSGNLEGLDGADRKCQTEAENNKLEGIWKAFLGNDQIFAIERLNLEGIFIEAEPVAAIPEGKTCHRLLGRNFEDFFKKLSDSLSVNQQKFSRNFFENITNIWLGRINKEEKKECTTISTKTSVNISENYSFTTTCQNWSTDEDMIPGYPSLTGQKGEYPQCYTPQGIRIDAVGLAGLASGNLEKDGSQFLATSVSKPCDTSQKLLCIQQEIPKGKEEEKE